jgi:hypothetical protein
MNLPTKTTTALASTLQLAEVIAEARSVTREGNTVQVVHGAEDNVAPEMSREMAVAVQSSVADKLLQAKGWDILKQLFLITSELLQTTQLFVYPVIAEIELVKEKMGEHFEAFDKDFTALKEDLATMSGALVALSKQHEGKEGTVHADDHMLVVELASGYSNLQTQMETKVGPELMKQMSLLEAAGVGADVLFAALEKSLEESEPK